MHSVHTQADAPVIKEQNVARLEVIEQGRIVETDALPIAAVLADAAVQAEAIARVQFGAASGKAADANLGALEVGENPHVTPVAGRLLADARRHRRVLLDAAVTEIEPEYVHAGLNQSGDGLGAVAGGPHGGDNLGAPVRAAASVAVIYGAGDAFFLSLSRKVRLWSGKSVKIPSTPNSRKNTRCKASKLAMPGGSCSARKV